MAWGSLLPILLLVIATLLVVCGLLSVTTFLGPKRQTAVKQMPYESGMDPVGDARLLFLYPWAAAAWNKELGLATAAVEAGTSVQWIFGEVLVFLAALGLAYVYAWRRGVFRWRRS